MQFAYPFQFDSRGRTATTDPDSHVRDLIEQVLFTAPGERVNRPSFGTGLMQLVFAPNSPELAAATQLLIQSALHQWLGDVILVQAVDVNAAEATLQVTVSYIVRQTQVQRTDVFQRGGPAA
jgi:phage baseplate assembly protein W